MSAPLAIQMRAYATEHPGNERMVELADAMDKAIEAANADWTEITMRKMIGATARARLHWCKVTGESLVSESATQAGARLISELLKRAQK